MSTVVHLPPSSAEAGEQFSQSGLFSASAQGRTRSGGGGRLRTRAAPWNRCLWSAGRPPGGRGAARHLCLAAEAQCVSIGGAFASVDVSSFLLIQFLLEKQGKSVVLLLLSAHRRHVRKGSGARLKTHALGRRPPVTLGSFGRASSIRAQMNLVHCGRCQKLWEEVWTLRSTTV